MKNPENTARTGARDVAGRLKPGHSGNPGGRPRRERVISEMLDRMTPAVLERCYQAAMTDSTADRKLILDRGAPIPRGGTTTMDLGSVGSLADCAAAVQRVADAVGCGDLAPGDAAPMLALIETARRMIENLDLDARLRALEARSEGA